MPKNLENEYCVVCLCLFTDKLYKCDWRDHYLCETCHRKINKCPECKMERKRRIEKQLTKRTIKGIRPCKNQPHGCLKVLPHHERLEHERICDFEAFMCPCLCSNRFSFRTLHIELDNSLDTAKVQIRYVLREPETKRFLMRYNRCLFILQTKTVVFGRTVTLIVTCLYLNNLRNSKISGAVPFLCGMSYKKYEKMTHEPIHVNYLGQKKSALSESLFLFQFDPNYYQYVLDFGIYDL